MKVNSAWREYYDHWGTLRIDHSLKDLTREVIAAKVARKPRDSFTAEEIEHNGIIVLGSG